MYVPLSAFWTQTSPNVVYKISKYASLRPLQTVYRNISIPRQLSDTRENFGGNNFKQGDCESRICYKLKEISSSPNIENQILGGDSSLCSDDSVPASGECRVDFRKVLGYIVNAGGINKRTSQTFGNIIINSISNSSCTTVHEVPAETTNFQPLFEKRLHHQSSSSTLYKQIHMHGWSMNFK